MFHSATDFNTFVVAASFNQNHTAQVRHQAELATPNHQSPEPVETGSTREHARVEGDCTAEHVPRCDHNGPCSLHA